MKNSIVAMSLFTACAFAANPLETVPWNGHIGAVSFTFDDALENQVTNLTPILDSLPEVKVTFFLTGMSQDLKKENVAKGFAELSKKSHEIGNHSLDHSYLTGATEDELLSKVVDYADTLESLMDKAGARCKITSFATPYCANSGTVQESIAKRHFINRDCGWTGRNNWKDQPKDWFTFQAKTWTRSLGTVEEMVLALDTAANVGDFSQTPSWMKPPEEGSWLVVLNHGVAEDSDEYAIDPKDISAIMKHARDNDMWAAPFGTVGAYYQAHFILDSATAIESDSGFKISWELPHPNMPQSVPVKVRLNSNWTAEAFGETTAIVLEQDGNVIWPDDDGAYALEFTKLTATIRKASAGELDSRTTPIKIIDSKRPRNLGKLKGRTFDVKGRFVK